MRLRGFGGDICQVPTTIFPAPYAPPGSPGRVLWGRPEADNSAVILANCLTAM